MAAENQDSENTPSAAVSGGVGTLLRETRQKLGQDLPSVATALRIRQPYLQAIEDSRFEDLPGATYAVGFVRGYAEYLGLDSTEILRRFKQENAEYATRAELVFPAAVSEGSIPTGALLGFAIVVAGIAYGAWYWYQGRESSMAEAVPALPERLAALIHRPVGSGSEVVPVAPADSAKPVEQTAIAQPSAAQPPTSPTAPAPAGAAHEDVVPPAEEEAAAQPAAPPPPAAQPAPALAAAPATTPTAAPAAAPVAGALPTEAVAPAQAPAVAQDAVKDAAKPEGKAKAAKNKDGKPDARRAGDGAPKEVKDAAATADAEAPARIASDGAAAREDGGAAKAAPASPTPANPVPAKSTEVALGGGSAAHVLLRANENCWIEIRDANGQVIHSRLLHKGETYPVPSRPGLHLTAGNAGALDVLVDGKPTGPLGSLGMVRRDVPLDGEKVGGEAPSADAPSAPASAPTE